ncbi:MAG: DUF4174 domain-containing protein [Flavobacteriaceae bacterium]
MKRNAYLFFVCFSIVAATAAQKLQQYKWKHRILILTDQTGDEHAIAEQLELFNTEEKAMQERDLIVLINNGSVITNQKGELLSIDPSQLPEKNHHGILLIGKDGGLKATYPFDTDPNVIFDRIDSMPMRRAEMRRSKTKN